MLVPRPATASAVTASSPKMLAIQADEKPSAAARSIWPASAARGSGPAGGSISEVPMRIPSIDMPNVYRCQLAVRRCWRRRQRCDVQSTTQSTRTRDVAQMRRQVRRSRRREAPASGRPSCGSSVPQASAWSMHENGTVGAHAVAHYGRAPDPCLSGAGCHARAQNRPDAPVWPARPSLPPLLMLYDLHHVGRIPDPSELCRPVPRPRRPRLLLRRLAAPSLDRAHEQGRVQARAARRAVAASSIASVAPSSRPTMPKNPWICPS